MTVLHVVPEGWLAFQESIPGKAAGQSLRHGQRLQRLDQKQAQRGTVGAVQRLMRWTLDRLGALLGTRIVLRGCCCRLTRGLQGRTAGAPQQEAPREPIASS